VQFAIKLLEHNALNIKRDKAYNTKHDCVIRQSRVWYQILETKQGMGTNKQVYAFNSCVLMIII
jgi:hypothetical protein